MPSEAPDSIRQIGRPLDRCFDWVMSMEDCVLRIERSIAARRTSQAEDGVSARRSHGSLLHELDQRVRGQRRSTIERCAEFDPCDFVINGQSGNAKGNPGKSKCVLDGISENTHSSPTAKVPRNAKEP